MDVSEILNDLNDKQREAVAAPSGNLLILAGAGSGKTRVLVHRIAWLIQTEHVSPFSIFAVTFTNKAASEMRSRIEGLLHIPAQGMWVGTFHSIAHRLLRSHWQAAGLVENFQILDSDDQLRLIKRLIKNANLQDSDVDPRRVQWFINDNKDNGRRAQHVEAYGDHNTRTLCRLYEDYERACERAGGVDFAELLLRAFELFKKNPDLLQHYQQRFKHVLVDEFQDTNTIQYAWLRLLAGDQSTVMAVGDDDQSIYGWRGAKVENILRFDKDYPDCHTIRLEQNYRSTANILNAANSLISRNTERLGKELWTAGKDGDKITVYAAFNDLEEARYIVSNIQHYLQEGYARDDFAILYRSNAQSRVIEEALIHAGIPYRVYGGLRFFDRAEIKDALAYLRLMHNRHDDTAMERVANNPPRGIGDRTMQLMRDHAREHNKSLWQSMAEIVESQSLSARANNAVVNFLQLLDDIEQDSRELELSAQSELLVHRSGLWDYIEKTKSVQAQSRLENLQELVSACKEFSSTYHSDEELSELAAFLSHAALESGDQQADKFTESVQLMTLHSAKGLEFPIVFLGGLEEGLFPHKMSVSEPGRLEEERRLCYVGMTRAKEKLTLTFAQSRRLRGVDEQHTASRFISEIGPQFLHHERMQSRPSCTRAPQPSRSSRGSKSVMQGAEIPDSEFRLGQVVRHAKFGDGVILNYEGRGANARLQIQFKDGGHKWLMAAYANLSTET